MSAEALTGILIGGLLFVVLMGYPLAFSLGGLAVMVGLLCWSPSELLMLVYLRVFGILTNYAFVAVPSFIFMGLMVQRSGMAERAYRTLHVLMGGLRGGLAIATIVLGTIMAAAIGIVGASVVMLGIIALPTMIKRGYDRSLACGVVCGGGTLGILIPPSIMLVLYGPMAVLSVGKLFMAAFGPGLLLSALYMSYVGVRCFFKPVLGPTLPVEERAIIHLPKRILMLASSLVPFLTLIVVVLGSIFAGIASPTEAAAVGAVGALLLAAGYRSLSWQAFIDTTLRTVTITATVVFIGLGASIFTGVFLGAGCGDVATNLILAVPFGRWGSFAMIMLIVFILGAFIDWLGIVLVLVPIITPIGAALGFDPLWFAMMIIVNLQFSFITPPFAYAIFWLHSITEPEWGITTATIIRGVIPFIAMIAVGLALCVIFPDIILWLPAKMVG